MSYPNTTNPLSEESIQEVKKFNSKNTQTESPITHEKMKWIIFDQEDYKQSKKFR